MSNILMDAVQQVKLDLTDHGLRMDSWIEDAIIKSLTHYFNLAFEQGRAAGLKDVLDLFQIHGTDYVK